MSLSGSALARCALLVVLGVQLGSVSPAMAQPIGCPLGGETATAAVATGLRFAEGALWRPAHGDWLISDVAANQRYRLAADGSGLAPEGPASSYANGNAWLPDGALASARHDRRLVRVASDGTITVLAERYRGGRLNGPNDLAVAPDGAVWFTDPTFAIEGFGPERAATEQPVRGVYRLPSGAAPNEPELVTGALTLPNGIAFAPNGRTLYVDDTATGVIHRLPIGTDGRPAGEPMPFAQGEPGIDGLRVDRAGRVWAAGPKGVAVYAPDGARLCGTTLEAEHVSNLALGGPDGRSVLVTATDRVFLLRATETLR